MVLITVRVPASHLTKLEDIAAFDRSRGIKQSRSMLIRAGIVRILNGRKFALYEAPATKDKTANT